MFRMIKLATGTIQVDGDEKLLQKIEGQDLTGVDISDLHLDADTLSQQYSIADSTPDTVYTDSNGSLQVKKNHEPKRYAVLKNAFLAKFSK